MALHAQEASTPQILEGLNDIIVPEPVSLVPQTAGWIVLGVLLLAALTTWATFAWRRYRRNAYRREALNLLDTTPPQALPALVKRVALASAPRAEVASLTGDRWLQFLDQSYGGEGFSNGPGRVLATLSFAPAVPDAGVSDELHDLVSLWIRRHRV